MTALFKTGWQQQAEKQALCFQAGGKCGPALTEGGQVLPSSSDSSGHSKFQVVMGNEGVEGEKRWEALNSSWKANFRGIGGL